MAKITVDGKEYDTESMSEKELAQVQSIQYVNNQILELQMRSAAYQTARNGYIKALKALLEDGEEEGKDEDSANISLPENLTFD
jgi:hypothetical protein